MGRSRMPKTAKVTAAPNEGDVVRNPELKRDGAGSGPCIDEEWRVFICFHNLTIFDHGAKMIAPRKDGSLDWLPCDLYDQFSGIPFLTTLPKTI